MRRHRTWKCEQAGIVALRAILHAGGWFPREEADIDWEYSNSRQGWNTVCQISEQVYHEEEYESLRALGFQNIIFTLYQTGRSERAAEELVRIAGGPVILQP